MYRDYPVLIHSGYRGCDGRSSMSDLVSVIGVGVASMAVASVGVASVGVADGAAAPFAGFRHGKNKNAP